jgi:membrane-bound lytic murein transglycosylase F
LRVLTAVILAALLGSCSSPPSLLERILTDGKLRVVTLSSPTTYYADSGEARGLEHELAARFAERLGVELELYAAESYQELFTAVARGRAHIAAAGLSTTAWENQDVAFGPVYQTLRAQVIYRRGAKRPRAVADLAAGTIEVSEGSAHTALLEDARGTVPNLRWSEQGESAEALIRDVADGEVSYTIVNSNEFNLLRHYYPEAAAAFELGSDDVAWALPRDAEDLQEQVAAYFAEIGATGELEAVLDNSDHPVEDFDFVGSRAFVRHLSSRFPRYQATFEQAERETGVDWRLLAAISYQESHWDSAAVSPTGVRGLMMLTQLTAEMMDVPDRSDPEASILGGARYFENVLNKIPERIPAEDRQWLAVAAYNIGFGHVEDARIITEMQGGNPDSWEEVRVRLPLLSNEDWHSRVERGFARGAVPVEYVDNVRRYYTLLRWTAGTQILAESSLEAASAATRALAATEDRG